MFIRVVHPGGGDTLHECRRVHTVQEGTTRLFITLEGPGREITRLELDKAQPEQAVYVMNNEGRTIDTIFSNRS